MLDFVNTKKALRYSVRPVKGFSCSVKSYWTIFLFTRPLSRFLESNWEFQNSYRTVKSGHVLDFPVNASRRRKSNDNTTFILRLRVWSEFSNNDYCCSIGVRTGKRSLTSTIIVIRSFKCIFSMYFIRIWTCSAAHVSCRQVKSLDVRHRCVTRIGVRLKRRSGTLCAEKEFKINCFFFF